VHLSDGDSARNNRNQRHRDKTSEENSCHIILELMPEINAAGQFRKKQDIHDNDYYFLPEVKFFFHLFSYASFYASATIWSSSGNRVLVQGSPSGCVWFGRARALRCRVSGIESF